MQEQCLFKPRYLDIHYLKIRGVIRALSKIYGNTFFAKIVDGQEPLTNFSRKLHQKMFDRILYALLAIVIILFVCTYNFWLY